MIIAFKDRAVTLTKRKILISREEYLREDTVTDKRGSQQGWLAAEMMTTRAASRSTTDE